MPTYYKKNYLKPNPTKTPVHAFYLNSKQANRRLNVTQYETPVENLEMPNIVLDRTLTYKITAKNTQKSRNTKFPIP